MRWNGTNARQRDDGDRHDGEADRAMRRPLRRDQRLPAFDDEKRRRTGDEGALRKARQRLGLAMAETMLVDRPGSAW